MSASAWTPSGSGIVLSNLNRVSQEFTATGGQTLFTITTPYTPGAVNLEVFKNGAKLLPSVVTEISGGLTFTIAACAGGDKIETVVFPGTSNNFVTLANNSAASAAASAASAVAAAASAVTAASYATGWQTANNTFSGSNQFTGTASVKDSLFSIQDDADVTKNLKFQAGSIGAGQTRTITMPDTDVSLGSLADQILPFTCTQLTNILTGTLAAGSLKYRSATAADGTPVQKANGVLTLSVPATSNLGMLLTAQVNRLVWLVAYNAGTPVLCVVNVAGGNSLDETGFISPTTIGAASNTANVIYSASAVAASSPYRVVGFCDVVFTTGTGWSSPTLVQGAGGQAFAAVSSIGYGQTWQNLTASRTATTTYYNTTGKPIFVVACLVDSLGQNIVNATVNGINSIFGAVSVAAGFGTAVSFVVPPGASYSVTIANFSSVAAWRELR